MPSEGLLQVPFAAVVENENRQVMLFAERDRRAVHEPQVLLEYFRIGQIAIHHRVRIALGIVAVYTVITGSLEQDVRVELERPLRRGSVGRHKGATNARRENDDAALFEMPGAAAADVGLGVAVHAA